MRRVAERSVGRADGSSTFVGASSSPAHGHILTYRAVFTRQAGLSRRRAARCRRSDAGDGVACAARRRRIAEADRSAVRRRPAASPSTGLPPRVAGALARPVRALRVGPVACADARARPRGARLSRAARGCAAAEVLELLGVEPGAGALGARQRAGRLGRDVEFEVAGAARSSRSRPARGTAGRACRRSASSAGCRPSRRA